MRSFTSADASKKFGEVLKLADNLPVEITRHGRRRRYIVMSREVFDAYEFIRRAHAEDRVLVSAQSAIGKLMKSDDEDGFKRLRLASGMMGRFLKATGEKL